MKQYLSSEQTAKQIELGLPKPKSEVKAEQAGDYAWYNPAYSIGELIEIINQIDDEELRISRMDDFWTVATDFYGATNRELVDALYGMIVVLKEFKAL